MSGLQLKRIIIALVAVVFFWGLAAIFGRRETDDLEGLVVAAVTPASIDTVVIARPADTVVLARQEDESWTVNGFAASSTELDALFDAFEDSTLSSELVARSSSSHQRMGIDGAQGRHVTLSSGGAPVVDLLVGDAGRQYETAYVRRPGEDLVYLVRGRLNILTDRGEDAWRDKDIARIDTAAITTLELSRGGSSYALRRAEGGWEIDGGEADSLTVSRILMELVALRATGFPTAAQLDSIDFSGAERGIGVVGADGVDLLRVSFDSTSSWFWAQRVEGGPIYRVDRWRVDRLVPADTTLRKPAL